MGQMTGKNFPKRGEIYWTDLDPAIGGETKKTRPAVVVSNDIGNEFSQVVMIAPITSKIKKVYSFEVETIVNDKRAKIMLNQSRAIDKSRLQKLIEQVDEATLRLIDEAIKLVFGIK